jgi:hypothetical protein
MQPKAIATHTIFLIAAIGLFLIFTIISLWFWLDNIGVEFTNANCKAKYIDYCLRWLLKGKDPGNWSEYASECKKSIPNVEEEDCRNLLSPKSKK